MIHFLKSLGDERGSLVFLEGNKTIPFDIKRVFYIYNNVENFPRGKHAHYKTQQYLIAVNGWCSVKLFDGMSWSHYDLNSPTKGLFQDAMIWGEMYNFSKDCVLLVLASEEYNERDYIRDFDTYVNERKNK